MLQSQHRGRENSFFGGSHAAQELLDPSVLLSSHWEVVHLQLYHIQKQLHVSWASVQVHMGCVLSKAHDNLHNMVLEQAVPSRCVEAPQHIYIHSDVYCLKQKFGNLIQILNVQLGTFLGHKSLISKLKASISLENDSGNFISSFFSLLISVSVFLRKIQSQISWLGSGTKHSSTP